jgi:hypothetical protein
MLEEAAAAGIPAADLQGALRALGARFDRVVTAVSKEHAREKEGAPRSAEQRRADLLRRLLIGDPVDSSELRYDLDVHHLGIVASGHRAVSALRALGEDVDRSLLLGQPDEQTAWAWLGGRRSFDSDEVDLLLRFDWPAQTSVAYGEPARGLGGWRLTHRQAAAAIPLSECLSQTLVRYPDVALLASVLQDDLLVTSLRRNFLAPLEADRDGGAAAKETLRAYFDAAGNISSAAAALGVNRRTVSSRIAAIEKRLDRPLEAAAAEIEVALRVDRVERR